MLMKKSRINTHWKLFQKNSFILLRIFAVYTHKDKVFVPDESSLAFITFSDILANYFSKVVIR